MCVLGAGKTRCSRIWKKQARPGRGASVMVPEAWGVIQSNRDGEGRGLGGSGCQVKVPVFSEELALQLIIEHLSFKQGTRSDLMLLCSSLCPQLTHRSFLPGTLATSITLKKLFLNGA